MSINTRGKNIQQQQYKCLLSCRVMDDCWWCYFAWHSREKVLKVSVYEKEKKEEKKRDIVARC